MHETPSGAQNLLQAEGLEMTLTEWHILEFLSYKALLTCLTLTFSEHMSRKSKKSSSHGHVVSSRSQTNRTVVAVQVYAVPSTCPNDVDLSPKQAQFQKLCLHVLLLHSFNMQCPRLLACNCGSLEQLHAEKREG